MKYAFVLIHFGSNPIYFEYELYSVFMIRSICNYDFVYMYSKSDTPSKFVEVMKKFNVKTVEYDDSIINKKIDNFKSVYEHFNTFKTCAFFYANMLTEYDKVCVIESDQVYKRGFEKVFELDGPAILYYNQPTTDYDKNNKLIIDKKFIISECNKNSHTNGGILVFKPDKQLIDTYIKNMDVIAEKNCSYPNETLFLYTNNIIYNVPFRYNSSHYMFEKRYTKQILNYHFNSSIYKPLNIIKDKFKLDKKFKIKNEAVDFFKNNFYNKYHERVDELMKYVST
jgi:hypothetical protein